jgi:WD40 repeat protein
LSVAVSHDGAWVVSGSKDRGVQFWDSRTAIVQCMLQGHKNSGEFLLSFRFLFGFLNGIASNIYRFESGWEYFGYRQWGLASTDMYVSPILQSL